MEFETIFARIGKMRDALRAEFDVDAEGSIAEIDRAIESEIAKDPLLAYASNLFYKAGIALRHQRIDVARRLQSNGVTENMSALEYWLWDARLIDTFVANLRQGEKLVEVKGFTLTTNQRVHARAGLKTACRMTVEMNDANFARNFTSDEKVHEVEARHAQLENPILPGSRGSVSNSDWPRR
jgi:hypothetical protein